MSAEHFDVLIMGAGLSGIDAAHHLRKFCPRRTWVILEQRERIGGTWDLFRYPGIRSDSDMLTMGYAFRPWTRPTTISAGPLIREYISDAAREEGIDRQIRFRHSIRRAEWSSLEARWTVEAVRTLPDGVAESVIFTCGFLFSCAGYYRYSEGFSPEFPGAARFRGPIIHPQHWPEDLDYSGKRVAIVGSGATAVTLLPAMAQTAAHVTMIQRSPTYVVSRPANDPIAAKLKKVLPDTTAIGITRWFYILFGFLMYQFSRWKPELMKKRILEGVQKALGPDFDVATHFTPRYNPWDQRMCLVPDADMFEAIKAGKASVVTGTIETFTESGIRLESGDEIAADVIVTATGLMMQAIGGIEIAVDGRAVDIGQTLSWKGVMMSGVPNFAAVFGYINASWTLKADLICEWLCRLLNFMELKKASMVVADAGNEKPVAPFVEHFSSGYMKRALESWPKQGAGKQWRANQNYFKDIRALRWARVDDEGLRFSSPGKPAAPVAASSTELAGAAR